MPAREGSERRGRGGMRSRPCPPRVDWVDRCENPQDRIYGSSGSHLIFFFSSQPILCFQPTAHAHTRPYTPHTPPHTPMHPHTPPMHPYLYIVIRTFISNPIPPIASSRILIHPSPVSSPSRALLSHPIPNPPDHTLSHPITPLIPSPIPPPIPSHHTSHPSRRCCNSSSKVACSTPITSVRHPATAAASRPRVRPLA